MVDPTSQDFFGSEAGQLPGTRRGFGTVAATDRVAPFVPAPTPPPTSGGSLAPPPVPSASSSFGTTGNRFTTGTPDGGVRLATPSAAPPPPIAPPPLPFASIPGPRSPGATPLAGGGYSVPTPGILTSPGFVNTGIWGGGWDQTFGQGLPRALQLAIANGRTGQSAIDYIRQTFPALADQAGQIAYYAGTGQYGLPGNMYVAPNAQQNGALDLIQRPAPEGGGAAPAGPAATSTLLPPAIPTTGAPTSPLDLSAVDQFTDPSTQFLTDFVKQYMATLLAPPYTDQQTAAIKAGPRSLLESNRQAEIQNAKEQLGSFGIAPTSGVIAATIQQINQKYDALQAQSDNTFATGAISRSDANKEQALSLAGLLADLPVQRLQVAEQAAGMGTNPASVFQQLMQLMGAGQSASLSAAQLQNQLYQGFGSIMGSIAARSGNSGSSAATGTFSPNNFFSF